MEKAFDHVGVFYGGAPGVWGIGLVVTGYPVPIHMYQFRHVSVCTCDWNLSWVGVQQELESNIVLA